MVSFESDEKPWRLGLCCSCLAIIATAVAAGAYLVSSIK